MAETTGITKASVTGLFVGQSDIILFDAVSDYNTAALATLANPCSLGDIVGDSTSYDGDEPTITEITNEKGDVITAKVTAGTIKFSFEMADTDPKNLARFLDPGVAKVIEATAGAAWDSVTKVTSLGIKLPVMTRPIMVANDEGTRSLLVPKGKIISSLSLSDGMWRIKATVTAEKLDTATLSTALFIEGQLKYKAA